MSHRLCFIGSLVLSLGLWLVGSEPPAAPAAEPPPATAAASQGLYLGKPLSYWCEQAAAEQRTEPLERIVAALTAVVRGGEEHATVDAADAIRVLGPAAKSATQALASQLDHPQAWMRTACMDALAAIGREAVPVLIEVFQTGSPGARTRAMLVLSAIGPDAKDALPALEQAAAADPTGAGPRLQRVIAGIRGEVEGVVSGQRTNWDAKEIEAAAGSLPTGSAGDWPTFRGPNRDAICGETGLFRHWSGQAPKLLWTLRGLGQGYSSVSIAGSTLFTMGDRGAQDGEKSQCVLAYDLDGRTPRWAVRIGPPHEDGPRCTPTWDQGTVFALGTEGDLLAIDAATGQIRWQRQLVQDFGGRMMTGWKFSESPLVDGPRLICTPGGPEATLVALDKMNGRTIWKCAVPPLGELGKDGAGYSSAIVADLAGVRQVVQVIGRGVVGVDAETGRFLWGYNRIANDVANIPSPAVRGNFVFVSTSYKTGAALLRVTRDGDQFSVGEVYFVRPRDFENHHGGFVLVGDYVYGGSGQNAGHPACLRLSTGELVWKDRAPSYGSAAVLYADGHLLFRYDRGLVALLEASPEGYRLKGSFTPELGDGPAWAHPVIHRGRLYLRHGDLLACYDLPDDSCGSHGR